MPTQLLPYLTRAADSDNKPFSGAKWYFYAAETDSPRSVYADSDKQVELGSVVTADSGGMFPAIYLDAEVIYRGVCKSADGAVTLHDIDVLNPAQPTGGGGGDGGTSSGAVLPTLGGSGGTLLDQNGNVWRPSDLLNSAVELTAGGKLQQRNGAQVVAMGEIDFDEIAGTALADLNEAVNNLNADGVATSERITAAEGNIALRATTVYVDNQLAQAVISPQNFPAYSGLEARVTAAEVDINSLEGQITTKVSSTQFTALGTRVGAAETQLGVLSSSVSAESNARTALGSQVASNQASFVSFANTQATTNTNLSGQITANSNGIGALSGTVTGLQNAVGAVSSQLTTTTTTVGALTSTVTTFQGSLDGINGRAGVRIDVNGRVTGWLLNNNGNQGDFDIVADKFRIWGTGMSAAQAPFEVDTQTGSVIIKNAVIGNASIGTLKIADGSITDTTSSSNGAGIFCNGYGNWITATSHAVTLAHSGRIIADAFLQATFSSANLGFALIVNDGTTDHLLQSGSGNVDHYINLGGEKQFPAGTYGVRVDVMGDFGASYNPGAVFLRAMRTYK